VPDPKTATTGHPGARTTSYVGTGDANAEAISGETRDRWYFIESIEVMAPQDAYAIAALGDSITDGYGILNEFARWPDYLTLAIKKDPKISKNRSVLNFGMGANNLTSSSTYQDSGVKRFDHDVLSSTKIKWLVLMEGVNDMNSGSVSADALKKAYTDIVDKAHQKGILVYCSPITPCDSGSCGSARKTFNDWVELLLAKYRDELSASQQSRL
jgi:lysophospholipase L1-like esterase